MKRRTHLIIRKTHRYLGLFLGVQFFLWTLGGLYFSWSNIDEIHGDFQRKPISNFNATLNLISPSQVLESFKPIDSLKSLQLINILGTPVYQFIYYKSTNGKPQEIIQLANAQTGKLRPALSKAEALQMALNSFNEKVTISRIEYLIPGNVDGHHEYRESPLPAWAITMNHPTNTTVYVAAEQGVVTKFRNNKWRIFDFLWMLHTMDYQSRDFIGNMLLRTFSIAGMVTILSGFALYFVSFKVKKSSISTVSAVKI